jgi:chitinase
MSAALLLALGLACAGDDGEGSSDSATAATASTSTTATSQTSGATTEASTGESSTSAGTSDGTTADPSTTTTASTTTDDPSTTSATGSGGETTTTGGGSSDLGAIVDADLWDELFPNRDELFTYDALIDAAVEFPAFAATGDDATRRRELAAFLANIGHETTGGWPEAPGGPYAWGLYFKEEVGCEMGDCVGYCDPNNAMYPCAPGVTYHGRGPMQLSWNYNYGQAGDALGEPLLAQPELVASDGVISFRTALWFWMTPQAPKPSAHAVMTGAWVPTADDVAKGRLPGFGMTINIINGGLECGKPTPPQVEDRLGFYARLTDLLGVDGGDNQACEAMQPYG